MSDAFAGMRQVGEFNNRPRRMIRQPKNPQDIATIVSIFPMDINENKYTIWPGQFKIAAGSVSNPSVLTIGPSSWYFDRDLEMPIQEMVTGAVVVAESVINDYCSGLLEVSMPDKMPGLFFVPGEVTSDGILVKYKSALHAAKVKQDAWYQELVKQADGLWATSRNNPLAIWGIMKMAAKELGVDRPWLADFKISGLTKCFACGNLRDPEFPICPTCKTIDMSHPRASQILTAQQNNLSSSPIPNPFPKG